MRPVCQILIDGRPASGLLMERLSSCVVTDEDGFAFDRVEIELADDPPAAIPRLGAVLQVSMGYGSAPSFMGEFRAEEVELGLGPRMMRIRGTAAGLMGAVKGQKERHWDDVTLGSLVETIAAENGLRASVDAALASYHYAWVGQVGESDVDFLERLARRHNALFSIKNGALIFAVRGSGLSPSGAALTALPLTRSKLIPGSARVLLTERPKYSEVVAHYMDRASGKRREVKVPIGPAQVEGTSDGAGSYTIDQPFADEAEARAAAEAKVLELQRRAVTFSADIVGDPAARGGAPVTFVGVHPGVDGLPFIAESAVHRFTPSGGYTTSLTGSLKA